MRNWDKKMIEKRDTYVTKIISLGLPTVQTVKKVTKLILVSRGNKRDYNE